jgi:hypothetical protein
VEWYSVKIPNNFLPVDLFLAIAHVWISFMLVYPKEPGLVIQKYSLEISTVCKMKSRFLGCLRKVTIVGWLFTWHWSKVNPPVINVIQHSFFVVGAVNK